MNHPPTFGAGPVRHKESPVANKDLIKRAFSVTANLPPLAKADTTPVEAAPEPVIAATAVNVAPPPDAERPRTIPPRTGPGSMLAFMTDQSEVHREVVRLREQMTEFEGASATRKIDPSQVRPSKWANRDESHFSTDSFRRLKQEIESAGGNIQPIKVRPLPTTPGHPAQWEIVFGHRRHRACLELGIPVLALIQNTMGDADLFVEMERENREREDLSAWEQGVMYMRALELGLFPSAKQLAAAIDRDMGNISKAMALAKLPAEVVQAFGSPLNLQFRWATPLKDAHQQDPEQLLATARELVARPSKPTPAEVFALLTRPAGAGASSKGSELEWKDERGVRIATLKVDRKGRAALSFEQAMDEAQQRKLAKLVDGFLGHRKG